MKVPSFEFTVTDFEQLAPDITAGQTGVCISKTFYRDQIRIRLVMYSANYLADHWCQKGHVIYCLQGSMETELRDGRKFNLKNGMVYTVGDNAEEHRSFSKQGCTLFIVD